MKAVTVKELKLELNHLTNNELIDLCLQLSKFKKENKELLTYVLFKASNEEGFIETIKNEADILFKTMNTNSYFYIKKSVRKIVRILKTNIRYSKKKETEIELLLYFCKKMTEIKPTIKNNTTLKNIYFREKLAIKKKLINVHEDLQYDYNQQLSALPL